MIEKLKDIKPIVQIPDNSLIMISVVVFVIMIVLVLLYLLLKKPKRRKKPTLKEIKLKELKELDFSDDKEVAYRFTTDAYLFLDDANREKYNNIEKELSSYKYKKEVPSMPKKLKDEIKEFIRGLS